MIETQLIFQNEYRWDLKKVASVFIPYLFNNDASLIITIESKTRLNKNYANAGKLNQILIDYPGKLIASSQVVALTKNCQVSFSQQGRFQLEFFPYQFLGKTVISINRVLNPPISSLAAVQADLDRIESKIDDISAYN